MNQINGQRLKKRWLKPSEALNRPFNRQIGDTLGRTGASQEETIRRLGFHVSNIGLLIEQHATSELTELLPVCPIPNTANWLLGLINLRGNLVPVFDLNLLLQLEKGTDKKPMLLILGQGDAAGAIVINGFPIHITFIESDKLQTIPPLPPAIKPYTTSGFEKNNEVWFNFDHLSFFHSLTAKIAG